MTDDNAIAGHDDQDEQNPFDAFDMGEMEQFDDLMSNYLDSMSDLEVGQLTKATIVEIGKDSVLLDVGDKAEGVCPQDAADLARASADGRDDEQGLEGRQCGERCALIRSREPRTTPETPRTPT